VLGLGLGVLGIRLLLSINTAGLPRVGAGGALVGLDWRVATFAVAVSLVTGLVFGLLPALTSSRLDLTTSLKEGGRAGSGGQNRARAAFVVTEVALALVLLVGSALLIRTAVAIARVDPGFDATNVLTMRTSLTRPELTTSAGVAQLVRVGMERLRAVPGVADATAACCVPLQGGYGLGFVVSGRPLEGPDHGGAAWMTVSPGYFEVFRIALKRGRLLTDRDDAAGVPVVVINETMARQFWPEGDPLADRLIIGRAMREFEAESERQIIGIVADTRDGGLNADPQPRMFIPQAQLPDAANALNVRLTPMAWFVRTRTPATPALAQSIEDALVEATGLPVTNRRAMDDIVSASTSRERFNMWLMSVFGASALLLAAIGIYGLMAYSVAQRTREIGIRLALGARASEVRRLVILQGMRLAVAGIGLGLAASFGLARFLTSFLFGVTERDPLVFIVAPLVLAVVALVAVWVPARRASAVDPLAALRNE
jgi:predicted permease